MSKGIAKSRQGQNQHLQPQSDSPSRESERLLNCQGRQLIRLCWRPGYAHVISILCVAFLGSRSQSQQNETPDKPEIERLWADLGEADTAKATRAVAMLSRAPKETTTFIAATLSPAVAADPQQVDKWIKDLNNDLFTVRARAMRELEKFGELAVPRLRAVLKTNPPLEVHVRVENLLKRLIGPVSPGDNLRVLRAVEVLERLGTDEAKSLLQKYASGAAGARLTEEAQDSIARLEWIEPKWDSPRKVISLANVARVTKIDEFARDEWEMDWWPRTREMALLSWEKPVEVLNPESFQLLRRIGVGMKPIHFAVSRDANTLALCENTTQVLVQNLRNGRSLALETDNHQPHMALSSDGRILATGGYGTKAKLWDASAGLLLHSLDAGSEGGLRVVFSPDEKILAIGNRNEQTRLYEVATGKMLHVLSKTQSHGLKFSPDGRTLAVAYVNGSIGLWDVASGKLMRDRATAAKEIYRVEWSPRGDIIATSGLNAKITLWDPRDLSVLKELEGPEWVICVRFSPDGTRLLSAGGATLPGQDRKVTVWGLIEGRKQ